MKKLQSKTLRTLSTEALNQLANEASNEGAWTYVDRIERIIDARK